MGRFGIPEDEALENKMVSNAIESAQEKIEGYNFDSRKHVLEYDDVMNKQRKAIYGRRFEILFAEAPAIEEKAKNILKDVLAKIVEVHTISELTEEWSREEIEENLKAIFGDISAIHEAFHKVEAREELLDLLNEHLEAVFSEKKTTVNGFAEAVRMMMLRAIDVLWMEHLEAMEYMRGSVRLRAYGQRDPLIEYKNEGAKMFQQLGGHINAYIANLIFKIGPSAGMSATPVQNQGLKLNLNTSNGEKPASARNSGEIGRNDPCPCGSGKKFKRCHGA